MQGTRTHPRASPVVGTTHNPHPGEAEPLRRRSPTCEAGLRAYHVKQPVRAMMEVCLVSDGVRSLSVIPRRRT